MLTLMRRMLMDKLFLPHRACYRIRFSFVYGMRLRGSQFPYLVIWLLFVFNLIDVDAMTMLPREGICAATTTKKSTFRSMSRTWLSSFGLICRSLAYETVSGTEILKTLRAFQFPNLVIWFPVVSFVVTIWSSITATGTEALVASAWVSSIMD